MNQLRQRIHPGLRGALFYSTYWGTVGLYEPFLAVYFLKLGMEGTQIGWLNAVLPLFVMLFAPLITRLADYTQKRVLFLGIACLGYGMSLLLFALPNLQPTFPVLLGIVALISVFRNPINSLADSLVAPMASRYQLDFGAMRLWGSAIFTITAIGMGSVWERTGYGPMFLVAAGLFVPVTVAALLLEDGSKKSISEQSISEEALGRSGTQGEGSLAISEQSIGERALGGSGIQRKGVMRDSVSRERGQGHAGTQGEVVQAAKGRGMPPVNRGLWFLLGSTFLVVAALFMGGNFATIYMAELGGSAMMVGSVFGLGAMGEVPGMLFGNRIARRMGATNMLLLGCGLNAAGLLGYAFSQQPWMLLVFSLVRGLGFGMLLVGNVMLINRHAPSEYASTFQGVYNAACFGLAPLIGGPVSGWVYDTYGPSTLFFLTAAMTMLAAVVILPTYTIWKEK